MPWRAQFIYSSFLFPDSFLCSSDRLVVLDIEPGGLVYMCAAIFPPSLDWTPALGVSDLSAMFCKLFENLETQHCDRGSYKQTPYTLNTSLKYSRGISND